MPSPPSDRGARRWWVATCSGETPRCETRMERLEQRIDTLTELVGALLVALGQNAANAAPAIPLGIPLANVEGEEAQLPQEGWDATASGVRTNITSKAGLVQTSKHRPNGTRGLWTHPRIPPDKAREGFSFQQYWTASDWPKLGWRLRL